MSRGIRVVALDTAELARRHAPRADLVVRCRASHSWACSCAAPFASRLGLDTEAMFETLRGVLGHYFGKRGGAVVDANLALIRDAWGSLLDVTAAVAASSRAATADPLTPEEERLRGGRPARRFPRSLVETGR